MSVDETGDDVPPPIKWSDQGFAYVEGEVIVNDASAREALLEQGLVPTQEGLQNGPSWRYEGAKNALEAIELLQSQGYAAQPNHVFFAHPCGPGCPPHPSIAYELLDDGWWANPLKANPLKANPLKANPLKANPLKANPLKANHPMENSAVPAEGRVLPRRTLRGPGLRPKVIVLDTGLAKGATAAVAAAALFSPPLIRDAVNITGVLDRPDETFPGAAPNAIPADGFLDPVAGHGTFIAGLIEQLAPKCLIDVRRVINVRGDVSEFVLAAAIDDAVAKADRRTIISISLGGPTLDQPVLLRQAVARAVYKGVPIVASAGNEGTCVPQYPAAFPGVVAVGALGPEGAAPFTNYGPWVDACAPGTDLVSAFFDGWNGNFPRINSVDLDEFWGWATWSGTSFAAPVVVAALCREIVQSNCTATDAVRRVIRARHLMRIPCLGTVVNI